MLVMTQWGVSCAILVLQNVFGTRQNRSKKSTLLTLKTIETAHDAGINT